MVTECKKHGLVSCYKFKDASYKSGYRFRCKQCAKDAVAKTLRRNKRVLVEGAGGKCRICGYSRYVGALQFHHLDPSQKEFGISENTSIKSLDRLRVEAEKCVLLCGNCHAEVEAGVASL